MQNENSFFSINLRLSLPVNVIQQQLAVAVTSIVEKLLRPLTREEKLHDGGKKKKTQRREEK